MGRGVRTVSILLRYGSAFILGAICMFVLLLSDVPDLFWCR
jgi:hypothetical protein